MDTQGNEKHIQNIKYWLYASLIPALCVGIYEVYQHPNLQLDMGYGIASLVFAKGFVNGFTFYVVISVLIIAALNFFYLLKSSTFNSKEKASSVFSGVLMYIAVQFINDILFHRAVNGWVDHFNQLTAKIHAIPVQFMMMILAGVIAFSVVWLSKCFRGIKGHE